MSSPQPPSPWSDPTGSEPASPPESPATFPHGYAAPADPATSSYAYTPPPDSPYTPPPPGYQQPYPQYGYALAPATPATNGLAIASMVMSIVGIAGLCAYGLGGIFGLPGAILGHVARRQIRQRGESGDGMAMAGIIMGWIATAIFLLAVAGFVIFIVWAATHSSEFENNNLNTLRELALWLRSLTASLPAPATGSAA